jgi:hypothetical protein
MRRKYLSAVSAMLQVLSELDALRRSSDKVGPRAPIPQTICHPSPFNGQDLRIRDRKSPKNPAKEHEL